MQAVVVVVVAAQPDILFLQGIDYDYGGATIAALSAALDTAGQSYGYSFAARPNSGQRTGLDHDGDGRSNGPRDTQGFGYFPGQGGMAVLSRFPITTSEVRDFSALLWKDLPGAQLPRVKGRLFPDAGLYDHQRLSSVGHWAVPVRVGDQTLTLLGFHATPPVFDGPEDRNGLRNRDEIRLWQLYIDGALPAPPPEGAFIVLGDANLDPADGDGLRPAIAELLAHPRLQDPQPQSPGGAALSDPAHTGPAALDTVDWPEDGPGNLRVDYVLPSADLTVVDAGVVWPVDGAGGLSPELVAAASRHRLVWVDLRLP